MTQAEAGVLTRKLYRTIRVPLGVAEQQLWSTCDHSVQPANLAMYAQSIASGRPIEGRTLSSSKLDAVVEYVSELPGQAVILTHFTESLKYLAAKLPQAELIYGSDGGTQSRMAIMHRFQTGKTRIIIANIATVKVGINLSAASAIIFAENSFSGEARIQAEERATVSGKEAVEIVDFVSVGEGMAGAIDEKVLQCVRAKKDFNSSMLRR